MTIHHDKLAYGKLASNMEELSEQQINEMLKQLAEQADKDIADEKLSNQKNDGSGGK